jgi:hypothetical protein
LEDLAPIVLFVFNRPDHTRRTIEALQKNVLAADSTLFIYSDSVKSNEDESKVYAVRNFIKSFKGFKRIEIIFRDKNLGLAQSIISGVEEVLRSYQKVIVLEDDIMTSKNFLKFMNESLNFYRDEKKIYSISGYNFPIKIPQSYSHQVYISHRASSWGWATWKDRWEKAIWKPETVININDKKALRNLLDVAGTDLVPMLLKTIDGKINSWAVKWVFTHIVNDSFCIYPVHSFVNNIGVDATGTNFKNKVAKFNVEILVDNDVNALEKDLKYSEEIQKQINSLVNIGVLRKIINFIRNY